MTKLLKSSKIQKQNNLIKGSYEDLHRSGLDFPFFPLWKSHNNSNKISIILCFFIFTGCTTSPVYTSQPPHFLWPVKTKKITQKFKASKKHEGIDIPGSKNTPVYATANGRVIYTGRKFTGYGKLIIIEHQGEEWASFYAHLNKFKVCEGQRVKSGQLIGLMGNTGRSSGVHLHFEIRHNLKPVDPLPLFIKSRF